jgi:hypothetical protein
VNRLQRYQLQPEQQSSVAISARMDGWSPASTDLISGDAVPPTISQPYQPNETSCVSSRLQNGVSNASSPSEPGGPDGYFGDSSTFAFVSKVQPESQNNNGVHLPTKRNRELSTSHSMQITDGSTSRSTSDNGDIYKLPERHLADNLVDGYFDRVHPLYPFVHEGSFRAEYERMWAHMSDNPLRPLWYALLNLIFALGCEFCDAIPEETVMTTISPLVARSRHIIFSYGFSRSTLELVQVLLLMCHYLQGTLELNECWNLVGLMIRSAVSIGLHLNPDNLPLPTVEKEVRKRVWWGCFTIDRTLSMKFGRPLSIQTADVCDVPLPLEVDDQYIHNSSTPRQPAGRPSITAFFIYTIKLAKVIDNILRDLYTTNKRTSRQTSTDNALPVSSSQSRILGHAVLLDGQLQSWWKEIPAHLHPESRIVDGRVFQRQKFVIHVRYVFRYQSD